MAAGVERYGFLAHYPPDVPHEGRRPLLQFSVETIEGRLTNPRSVELALRFSGRIIAHAVGSPLENCDEEGVQDKPLHEYGDPDGSRVRGFQRINRFPRLCCRMVLRRRCDER